MIRFSTGLCVLLLLLAAPAPALAQRAQAHQHFDAGNQAYAAGDYRGAVAAYEQALGAGYASGALYLNLGNAYYRLDEIGQAIRYYEKARRLIPDDPRLRHNLTIARARTVDSFSQIPPPFWRPWWNRLLIYVGALPFFIAAVMLLAVGAGAIAYRIRTGRRTPWLRRTRTLALLLGGLLLAVALAASLSHRLDRRAVVIEPIATLREAPEANAAEAVTLHEGTVFEVLDRQEGWVEARLPNGVTGWLLAKVTADV